MNRFTEQPCSAVWGVLVVVLLLTTPPHSAAQESTIPTGSGASTSTTPFYSGSGLGPTSLCYDGEIIIANSTYSYINGSYFYGGRVEVCYNDIYYPVCDEGWTDQDAAVVCYYAGYSYYS